MALLTKLLKRSKRSSSRRASKGKARKLWMSIALQLFIYLRYAIDWLIDLLFGYFYNDEKTQRVPGVKESVLTESATSLAEKIRSRKVTSEAVVSAFIERIREVNPLLNAVVDERFNQALVEAKEADKLIADSTLTGEQLKTQKPFLGVPFTCKESTACKGSKFSCGLVSRKDVLSTEDAEIVILMKGSGAILLALTNIPEINLWCESRNNVYGQTNNPYNLTRTAGGSSGGEASIISACGSPFGLGSDIGGSTRIPAFFCGIFGHMPTAGMISTRGMMFRKGNEGPTMCTAGTLTRCVDDIAPFLRLLVADKISLLQLDTPVNVGDLRVVFIEEPSDLKVSSVRNEIKAAVRKAADHLASISSTEPEEVMIPGFSYSQTLWRHAMTKEPGNFAHNLANMKGEVSLWSELPKMMIGQSAFTLPSIMRLFDLNVLPPVNAKWAENETNHLRNELLELLGDDGVLLFPSHPTLAPHHYTPLLRPYNFAYWAIFNVLQVPVTQVPMGLSANGLPLGVQVVAAPYKDHLCIAVAKELERAFGGWVPPFPSAS